MIGPLGSSPLGFPSPSRSSSRVFSSVSKNFSILSELSVLARTVKHYYTVIKHTPWPLRGLSLAQVFVIIILAGGRGTPYYHALPCVVSAGGRRPPLPTYLPWSLLIFDLVRRPCVPEGATVSPVVPRTLDLSWVFSAPLRDITRTWYTRFRT